VTNEKLINLQFKFFRDLTHICSALFAKVQIKAPSTLSRTKTYNIVKVK